MVTRLDAASIARLSLHDTSHFSIQHSQTLHRLVLLQHWGIAPGSKVLELGCGQGDCTTVLASAVGEQGTVVAVDPAELDYGASFSISIRRPSPLPGLFYSPVGASRQRLVD
jgi:predicted methyltransferase